LGCAFLGGARSLGCAFLGGARSLGGHRPRGSHEPSRKIRCRRCGAADLATFAHLLRGTARRAPLTPPPARSGHRRHLPTTSVLSTSAAGECRQPGKQPKPTGPSLPAPEPRSRPTSVARGWRAAPWTGRAGRSTSRGHRLRTLRMCRTGSQDRTPAPGQAPTPQGAMAPAADRVEFLSGSFASSVRVDEVARPAHCRPIPLRADLGQ